MLQRGARACHGCRALRDLRCERTGVDPREHLPCRHALPFRDRQAHDPPLAVHLAELLEDALDLGQAAVALTAMLTARNILAGERLYDTWNVNEDAEYHEAGGSGVQDALVLVLRTQSPARIVSR